MYLHLRVIIALQIASCLITASFAVEGAAQEFAVQNKVMQGSAVRSETRTLMTPDACCGHRWPLPCASRTLVSKAGSR